MGFHQIKLIKISSHLDGWDDEREVKNVYFLIPQPDSGPWNQAYSASAK